MIIELNDICFAYDSEPVLSHFNLNVEKGKTVVLEGCNGCGKSTVLKIINGLLFADFGTYKFNSQIINKKALNDNVFAKKFHSRIGYVFQNTDAQLFCSNVYDEVAFGAVQMGLSPKEIESRTNNLLSLLEINKLKDRAPYHLSFGEKKKVAIASILITNPDVLVFDEPLSGLDEHMQVWLTDFILEMKQIGKTIIIVTHNSELAEKVADEIVRL